MSVWHVSRTCLLALCATFFKDMSQDMSRQHATCLETCHEGMSFGGLEEMFHPWYMQLRTSERGPYRRHERREKGVISESAQLQHRRYDGPRGGRTPVSTQVAPPVALRCRDLFFLGGTRSPHKTNNSFTCKKWTQRIHVTKNLLGYKTNSRPSEIWSGRTTV